MSLCYDFQKWTIISLAGVAISLSVGLLMQYAHGQESNSTGMIMKYKDKVYCYDSDTTTKKDVLKAIKNDWINQTAELFGYMFSEVDPNLAQSTCQTLIDNGSITKDSYLDKGIELDGTLTLEFK